MPDDEMGRKYVTVMILEADESLHDDDCPELQVRKNLMDLENEEEGRYVCPLLYHFRLTGPHERHLCLVFPVLGPSVGRGIFRGSTKKL